MGQPQKMFSLCFRSQDAVRTREGYQFVIESDVARLKPTRVSLGSIELPLSQPTITKEWNTLGLLERMVVTEQARAMTLHASLQDAEGGTRNVTGEVILPLHLNPVRAMGYDSLTRMLTVSTQHPHGLTSKKVEQVSTWDDVAVICAGVGHVSITSAVRSGTFAAVDDSTFTVFIDPSEPSPVPPATPRGFVLAPSPPSPSAMCTLLEVALRETELGTELGTSVLISYDHVSNLTKLEVPYMPPGTRTLMMSVTGDALPQRLGIPIAARAQFTAPVLPASTLGPGIQPDDVLARQLNLRTGNFGDATRGGAPYVLPVNPFALTLLQFRTGWYLPTRRSVPTAQPKRISQEFDLSAHSYTIRRREDGSSPALVFVDPFGAVRASELQPGRYLPHDLAAHLSDVMTSASAASFEVIYSNRSFTFACTGGVPQGIPRNFALLFLHPHSIDPARLGFEEVNYDGATQYTSSFFVQFPEMQWPSNATAIRPLSNAYTLSETSHNGRMRISAMAPVPLVALVKSYDAKSSVVRLLTYSNGVPVSHGVIPETIVTLGTPSRPIEIGENTVPPVPDGVLVRAVVLSVNSPNQMDVLVEPANWTGAAEQAIILSVPVEPFTISFARNIPNCIQGRLGFGRRSYEWGRDGIVRMPNGAKLPPFEAESLPALEHPEYVLLYLHEGKRSSQMHHYTDRTVTTPWAKIVLYEAAYREDRHLSRDVVLTSGESMSRFTLLLKNPDGTEYVLGAPFSFTVNFIV